MKKYLFLFVLCATFWSAKAQEGYQLWLPSYNNAKAAAKVLAPDTSSPTIELAIQELEDCWRGDYVRLVIDPSLNLGEGYRLTANCHAVTISASTDIGLLYGTYGLLRVQQTGMGCKKADMHCKKEEMHCKKEEMDCKKDEMHCKKDEMHCKKEEKGWQLTERPAFGLRLLNHWDNLDLSVERGYAGQSIWKWEEIGDTAMSRHMQAVARQYGRANASLGINGTVLNNVNASPKMLTTEQLHKVRVLADALRPYGLRVFLSINFATPMALGDTPTADPLDPAVRAWWTAKVREIYTMIPDFGGFLVKANSEGQPGPGDYGRSHADGANMLADALLPYHGIVMWRSFVYGANHKGEDRVKQAVSEFKPCDGKFHSNVILQSKNGPLDFQPREPYAPIFDQMEETPQMVEFQITQEYTGQSRHLVYLAPMWKEFFSFVSPESLVGIAGVANIGDDSNWCGHPFSQANWYAFGRLAWNPQLSSEDIAKEWLSMTFPRLTTSCKKEHPCAMSQVIDMMMTSREACVDYMMPLGLHHIFKFDHHYGPEPDGFIASYPLEWCPVYYHQADKKGIGFNRTTKKGTGATAQYREPYADLYNNAKTCPEEYLLWFHHLPWKYKMKNGHTLWQNLCQHYNRGVSEVERYQAIWQGARPYVDREQWKHVDELLCEQADNAREWRKICLEYFQTFSKMPITE